jgi:hypothetical protein
MSHISKYQQCICHWNAWYPWHESHYCKFHFQYLHLSSSGWKTCNNSSSSPPNCMMAISPVLVETTARQLSEVNVILWAEPTSPRSGTFCRLGLLPYSQIETKAASYIHINIVNRIEWTHHNFHSTNSTGQNSHLSHNLMEYNNTLAQK